jgi:pimeloyl-ACP methyl ester carboxylesterase
MADVEAARARLARAHPGLSDARVAELAEIGTRPSAGGGVEWCWDPRVREWIATHDRERYEECWAGVRCPTMVVTGGQAWERWWQPTSQARPGPAFDGPMSDTERDRRLGLFADVEHHTVDAGHMVHFDVPDQVVSLTDDFLGRRLG